MSEKSETNYTLMKFEICQISLLFSWIYSEKIKKENIFYLKNRLRNKFYGLELLGQLILEPFKTYKWIKTINATKAVNFARKRIYFT